MRTAGAAMINCLTKSVKSIIFFLIKDRNSFLLFFGYSEIANLCSIASVVKHRRNYTGKLMTLSKIDKLYCVRKPIVKALKTVYN